MPSTTPPSAYAAPFEISPGRQGYLVVARREGTLTRVDEVSDWLLAAASSAAPPNTLKGMAEALALWWRYCIDSDIDPRACSAVQFARFVLALQTVPKGEPLTSPIRGLPGDPRLRASTTVTNRVVHNKAFYKWAQENGRVSQSTARSIAAFRTPKAPKRQTADRLTPRQVQILLQAHLKPRDLLIVMLLYEAGLRDGEALGMMVEDLCMDRQIAEVFGCNVEGGPHLHVRRRINPNGAFAKSYVHRVVPLSRRLVHAIRDWNAWAFDHAPETVNSRYLVLSLEGPTRGRPLTPSGFQTMWNNHVRSIPGLEGANAHLLRHTFASELIDAGVPPFTVQTLLGHQSPTSTQIYTHALMQTLTDAVARLSDWKEEQGLFG